MSYCSLDEAFLGPANTMASGKKHKKYRIKEPNVPTQLPDVPSFDKKPDTSEVLTSSPATGQRLQGVQPMEEFFPLPGDTGTDSWENAFVLEPDFAKINKNPIQTSVEGKSTLWREIPVPPPVKEELAPVPNEVSSRLDTLTRQLDSLTLPSPMQTTAELFLFVAIGLLLLLALDTLLRFATTFATRQRGGGRSYRVRGRFR
jgi:hypothetical protein